MRSTKVDCVTAVPFLCEITGNISLITEVREHFSQYVLLHVVAT